LFKNLSLIVEKDFVRNFIGQFCTAYTTGQEQGSFELDKV